MAEQTQTKIQVFCGWCGKYMGTANGQDPARARHSVCPKCLGKGLPELAKARAK